MSLSIIGLGLFDEKDITVRGLEMVKAADVVYLECYTSVLQCRQDVLESFYGKNVIMADREMVESKAEETILSDAKDKKVALLVVGDPLGATTHEDIIVRARDKNIEIMIVPNASIFSSIGATGLQLYKFGKTASIPFYSSEIPIDTPLNVISDNKKSKSHTLLLLDLDPPNDRFMSVNDAISALLNASVRRKDGIFGPDTLCVGCARLGGPSPTIKSGSASLLSFEDFGKPPHCLIVPGDLHFMEEESLARFKAVNP
ncbi:MAG: diphthine synthase [Nanoarchaeota archaeon]